MHNLRLPLRSASLSLIPSSSSLAVIFPTIHPGSYQPELTETSETSGRGITELFPTQNGWVVSDMAIQGRASVSTSYIQHSSSVKHTCRSFPMSQSSMLSNQRPKRLPAFLTSFGDSCRPPRPFYLVNRSVPLLFFHLIYLWGRPTAPRPTDRVGGSATGTAVAVTVAPYIEMM